MKKKVVIAVLFLTIITVLAMEVFALACNPATDTSVCGRSITVTGNGATELCETCYLCGVSDGVCPEDYSSGTTETTSEMMRMMVRIGHAGRPVFATDMPDSREVIFNTGEAACNSLGGTCTSIETKVNLEDLWGGASGIGCNTDINGNTLYVRAICNNPKRAGCQNCPDPDCIADISGLTYDPILQEKVVTHVNIISTDNPNLRSEEDSTGVYNMQSPTGNVKVVCTAQDYNKSERDIFLQRGNNIIDCKMYEAVCSSECTLPDLDGQEVCRSKCDGQHGCGFANPQTTALCEGVPAGSTIVTKRINDSYVEAVNCCEGDFETIYRPLSTIESNNIPNLLTRDYRKKMDGVPVTLRIITYTT